MTLQELRKGIAAIRDEIASMEEIMMGIVFEDARLGNPDTRVKLSDHLEVIKNTAEQLQCAR